MQIGDWGRLGQYNQSGVAALMGRKAALEQPDFVISTGDNFYESTRLPFPHTLICARTYIIDNSACAPPKRAGPAESP